MDEQNTDSDSHSVTSTHSVSSTSSKQKCNFGHGKEVSASTSKPVQTNTKRRPEDEGKVGSTPKRKKADGADPTGTGAATPGSSSARKAAPLSERQQMALALAMSAQESGGTSPVQTSTQSSIAPDTTPRSAMLRKVNRRNEKGESPLHLATIKGDVDGMKKLLKAGAGVNVPDYAGWTALHEACNHGFVNAAKLLLRKGANVNAQGLDNDTPLHDAAINGHPELVALLLKYGANPDQANSKGQSPLDVALNDDITKLLKGETVFKLDCDDSDQSASSPESMLPKDEEAVAPVPVVEAALSSAKPSLDTSHAADRQLSQVLPAGDSPKPAAAVSKESIERIGGRVDTVPGETTTQHRPASTGFQQGELPPAHYDSNKALEKTTSSATSNVSDSSTTKQLTGDKVLAERVEDNETVTSNPVTSCKSPEVPSNVSIMDQQAQMALMESATKTARQSLNFQPIRVPSPTGVEVPPPTEPGPMAAAVKEEKPSSVNQEKPANPLTTGLSNISGAAHVPPCQAKLVKDCGKEDVQEQAKSSPEPAKSDGLSSASSSTDEVPESVALVPTPVHDVTTPEPSTEEATQHIPSVVVEFAPKKEQEEEGQGTKTLPSTEKKSAVEQVKLAEKKSHSRPASPAPEKSQRTRTGSMHRKRRLGQAPPQSASQTVDPPVQPDGDNSKDSTDSHTSNTGNTRSSRSRNKQNPSANTTATDEEPPPVRETRRKAMLKERAAANSPSAEKLVKSGSQKVPPLTIKLPGSKSPSSTAPATKDTVGGAVTTAVSGEPFVMLADKETERANTALLKEQSKDSKSPESQDNVEKSDASVLPSGPSTSTQSASSASSSSNASNTSNSTTSGVTTRRTLRSHTNRNQGNVGEKLEDHVPPRKSKRMMKAEPPAPTVQVPNIPPPPGPLTIFNPYSLFKDVREQMFKKWERIITVRPKAPTGYPSYMINTKKYLLLKNASTNASKLAIPLTTAPSQLSQPMKTLFNKQELERYKLRQQHLIEGEKLRIAYEQEIVRVYTRGARASVNQDVPLSVCTILKDKESGTVYHPFNALKERMIHFDLFPWPFQDGSAGQGATEDKSQTDRTSARSHFNNRQLISWLQDSEDKYEKLKDQMLSRHHHEAESLYAVQTMDWEWELEELGLSEYKARPAIDRLHVPMVVVNDDADILNSS